ncbi:fungal-specific transcription factor domain-containing protein [Mycena maculata]|uniref:Fungal-specific transcription factor domain-containing protein n=1 Tax=Mycena maculata TaxID=230809 RepID=A0AAD7IED8_9AGAR|nr:fungal-specific transcription factor domain-containing protein [Mycena maculata]
MADFQEDGITVPGSKRRRLRGSCDICKQRKIRCDSAQMPGNRCSNCIAFNSECTHSGTAAKKSSPSKTPPSQIVPEVSSTSKTAQAHVAAIVLQATTYIAEPDVRKVLLDVARYARNLENQLASFKQSSSLHSPSSRSSSPSSIKEEEPNFGVNGILSERFDRFRLDSDAERYFGKSSHFELINTAIDIKENFVLGSTPPREDLPPTKRPQFWYSPWEHAHLTLEVSSPPLTFPPSDLLQSLVSLFFAKVNIVLALLHRPTFERSLAANLHYSDKQFGETVLALCAVASKYSDDPRVVFEGTGSRLSSGWQYFRQLKPLSKPLLRSCTLYEAQTLCLCVIYLQGSSAPDGCWSLGGAGLRYAQEVGVHRRSRFVNRVEAEHWKRVFWVLICIDTLASSFCGRPRATSSTDYDLGYPVECDDEYWEGDAPDSALAWKQPEGKPSVLSYTVAYLKLIEILGMAQETIYLVNKKDKSEEWTKNVVANLDSALNAWIDVIPLHLRWDPHMEDPIFLTQSAVLYACYYHVQIQVHRIFIVGPNTNPMCLPRPSFNYPSLAICASSARACSHVMDMASRRGFLCNPHILNAVFDACIVLLLNVWGGRQAGLAVDPQKCLGDVEMCLGIFRAYESRWQIAGRQHDIITELMSATNMEPSYIPNPLKRGLDSEDRSRSPESQGSLHRSDSSPESQPDDGPTTPQYDFAPVPPDTAGVNFDPLFSLPMYTEDLGRLPVYEPLNWAQELDWVKNPHEGILLPLPEDIRNIVASSEALSTDSSLGMGVGAGVLPDSMSMLGETPGSYAWGDWGKYITNVEELMHSLENPSG